MDMLAGRQWAVLECMCVASAFWGVVAGPCKHLGQCLLTKLGEGVVAAELRERDVYHSLGDAS